MKIKPNERLRPTEKTIKPWERQFIGVEGPNVTEVLNLDDIGIAYSDYYISRITLPTNAVDIPLYWEGLEEELVFLMIRVRKDSEHNPHFPYDRLPNSYDTLKHITYYFSGFTGNTHAISEFFIQTGSYTNKIPTIYLNNPNSFEVVLDVFGAILDKPPIQPPYTGTTYYQNLFLESIVSDELIFGDYTGSTALYILDEYFGVGDILPYTGITSIEKDVDNLILTIISEGHIFQLEFLTELDFYQAYSRIKWVMNNTQTRFLNQDFVYQENSGYTGYDIEIPQIYIQSGMTPSIGTSKAEILEFFISGVTDFWDGNLDITGATSILNKYSNPVSLTGLTGDGLYQIQFTYFDNANNEASDVILFSVNFPFSESGATWLDSSINYDDIYFI